MSLLNDINTATLARVKARWPINSGVQKLSHFDVSDSIGSIACPGIHVSSEGVGYKKIAKNLYKKNVRVHVLLIFKNLTNNKERESGINIIAECVEIILCGQSLGLDISELVPISSPNVTDQECRDAAREAIRVDFDTSYDLEVQDDDDNVTDLLNIGLSFFLQPGGLVADAIDEVDTH